MEEQTTINNEKIEDLVMEGEIENANQKQFT